MDLSGTGFSLLVLLSLALPAALTLPPIAAGDHDSLSPGEIGFVGGGHLMAVRAALAALRVDGLVEPTRRGWVRTARPMRAGGDAVERAVYRALCTPTGPRTLAAKLSVRHEVAAMEGRLARAGLVPGELRRTACRVLLIATPVVGLAPLFWSSTPATIAILVVTVALAVVLWRASGRTVAGRRVLRALREELRRLMPADMDGEHEPSQSFLDGGLSTGVPITAGTTSRKKKAVALGLVGILVIDTAPPGESDPSWQDYYGFGDGDGDSGDGGDFADAGCGDGGSGE